MYHKKQTKNVMLATYNININTPFAAADHAMHNYATGDEFRPVAITIVIFVRTTVEG